MTNFKTFCNDIIEDEDEMFYEGITEEEQEVTETAKANFNSWIEDILGAGINEI